MAAYKIVSDGVTVGKFTDVYRSNMGAKEDAQLALTIMIGQGKNGVMMEDAD